MTFYFRPPYGVISLSTIEEYAVYRLEFLLDLMNIGGNSVDMTSHKRISRSECLIEGSQKDCISHYVLRLCLADDADTADFFHQAEGKLFTKRLNSYTETDLYKCLRNSYTQLKRIDTEGLDRNYLTNIMNLLENIKQEYSWKYIGRQCHAKNYDKTFMVSFTSALDLVSQRLVTLSRGLATVSYVYLHSVLLQGFNDLLRTGMSKVRGKIKTEDIRIQRLAKKLKYIIRQRISPLHHVTTELPALEHHRLGYESEFFPPCMKRLVHNLRTFHRLRHYSRIQLTLFLKEIGMPLHEALQLWRKEYSQDELGRTHDCRHNWKNDSKRYVYNIRHLYGLEGSKVNYRGHCCRSLQDSNLPIGECGGCPFQNSDNKHLSAMLEDEGVPHISKQILDMRSKGNYSEACGHFLAQKRLSQVLTNHNVEHNGEITMEGNTELALRISMKAVKEECFEAISRACNSEKCETQENICEITNLCMNNFKTTKNSQHLEQKKLHLQPSSEVIMSECYDHDLCLSQVESNRVNSFCQVGSVSKPSEFYFERKSQFCQARKNESFEKMEH